MNLSPCATTFSFLGLGKSCQAVWCFPLLAFFFSLQLERKAPAGSYIELKSSAWVCCYTTVTLYLSSVAKRSLLHVYYNYCLVCRPDQINLVIIIRTPTFSSVNASHHVVGSLMVGLLHFKEACLYINQYIFYIFTYK